MVARRLPWRRVEWRFLGKGVMDFPHFTFLEKGAQERVFFQVGENFFSFLFGYIKQGEILVSSGFETGEAVLDGAVNVSRPSHFQVDLRQLCT